MSATSRRIWNSWNTANYHPWSGPHGVPAAMPAGLCVLFGRLGSVYTSTHPSYQRSAWQKTAIDPGNDLKGVSCPTLLLCVAVDAVGKVLTSTDPTTANPHWSSADIDGTTPIQAVSCPTVSLCVAVDRQGNALTSTAPASGIRAWKRSDIDGTRWLTAISCPTAAVCVAADRHGECGHDDRPERRLTGLTSRPMTCLTSPATRAGASRRRPSCPPGCPRSRRRS